MSHVTVTSYWSFRHQKSPGGSRRGTVSLPCPIMNAPNRNEAGIPELTHQDTGHWNRITVYTALVCVYRISNAMAFSSKEYVTELFSSFERKISRKSVVHICWVKAAFLWLPYFKNCYPKIWSRKIQNWKKEVNKKGQIFIWWGSNLGSRMREANDVSLRKHSCWLKCNNSWIIAKKINLTELFIFTIHV